MTKAKAVKPHVEHMITLGRRGDLHARRQATAFLRSRDVVHKLFAEVGPRFKDRPGGYARIIKIGPRAGDAAEMAYLELVDEEYVAREREARTPEPVAAEVPAEAAEGAPETEAEAVEDPEAAGEVAAEDDQTGAPEADAEPAAEEVPDTEVPDTGPAEPSAEADDAEPKS